MVARVVIDRIAAVLGLQQPVTTLVWVLVVAGAGSQLPVCRGLQSVASQQRLRAGEPIRRSVHFSRSQTEQLVRCLRASRVPKDRC